MDRCENTSLIDLAVLLCETYDENTQNQKSENDFPSLNIVDEFDADFTESEIREAIFSQKDKKKITWY